MLQHDSRVVWELVYVQQDYTMVLLREPGQLPAALRPADSARPAPRFQGLFLALTLCVEKGSPVLKELPQGEVCANKLYHRVVHVITEMLKANSTNYYLADIQILFQTYHKGTISLRKSFFWLREFFSLSFNREKVCLDKIVRLGIRKKCLLKIIERFFC